ncbi:MAG: hypothetical protein K2M16_07625, partial [Muribaculaceae bacterium]|nr:hypothetical protein [Muribaculaceae bacterium]
LQESIAANGSAITALDEKLNGHIEIAGEKFEALTAEDIRLAGLIEGALESIAEINGKLGDYALKDDLENLKSVVSGHTTKLQNLEGRVAANETAITLINQTLTQLDTALGDLDTKVDGLDTKFTGEINGINSKLQVIDGKFEALDLRLDGIDTSIAGLNTALNGLTVRVETLENDLYLTKENVEELKQKVYFLGQQLAQLQNDFANLSSNVALLAEKVDAIENGLNALSSRMDNMITSILVQATDSPVFGNFSLPLGVKSTLLFNWYGYNNTTISEFPNDDNVFTSDNKTPGITFDGMQAAVVPVTDGFMGEVNLGRVYLTINPVGHIFDNEKFTLETSAGTTLPFGLTVKKSNEELTFGYQRSTMSVDGNGFYAGDLIIPAESQAELCKGIEAIRVEIDDNLKSAVKDVLKDRSKRNAVDLLKAVYGQLNGKFPAYAIRYSWDNNKYSVASNYDLAVATARPISYDNLKTGTSHKLPTFGHINNVLEQLKGKFKIEFTPISFENVKITLP